MLPRVRLTRNSSRNWLRQMLLGLLMGALTCAKAEEGMWTLDHLPLEKIKQEMGQEPSAAWVDRVQHAAVRLAGGCSGSFVSGQGLVLTNHHCAAACIEQLSDSTHDLIRDGFMAARPEEERRCPDMELNQLEQIRDVTEAVQQAVAGQTGADYTRAKRAVEARLVKDCVAGDARHSRCDLVELYQGARFQLYRYRRYQDVRLVFAPEGQIAFFGGDPDNFNFPRYNLDCSFVRAYEDNRPAATPAYLPFHAQGSVEGEPVFVAGHPGRTQRGLTMAQLDARRDVEIIPELIRLGQLRGYLTRFGEQGAEDARIAHTDLFRVENTRKALLGALAALQDTSVMAGRAQAEQKLQAWAAAHPDLAPGTRQAWQQIAEAQGRYRQFATEYQQLEGRAPGSQLGRLARNLLRAAEERTHPDAERLPEYTDAALPRVEQLVLSRSPIYREYEQAILTQSLAELRETLGPDHPLVRQVLGRDSPAQRAAQILAGTRLDRLEERRRLWEGGQAAVAASQDPMLVLMRALDAPARAVRKRKEEEVDAVVRRNADLINRARFARDGDSVYPDATFSLRLSYGRVAGWQLGERRISPFTTFGGTFTRATGAEPFALPARWLAAETRLDPQQPFNFVTTNDIIGGNSGSPMINASGQLVGLIFDGNIDSLAGNFHYDGARNRAVGVHAGAILQALQQVYADARLVDELQEAATAARPL